MRTKHPPQFIHNGGGGEEGKRCFTLKIATEENDERRLNNQWLRPMRLGRWASVAWIHTAHTKNTTHNCSCDRNNTQTLVCCVCGVNEEAQTLHTNTRKTRNAHIDRSMNNRHLSQLLTHDTGGRWGSERQTHGDGGRWQTLSTFAMSFPGGGGRPRREEHLCDTQHATTAAATGDTTHSTHAHVSLLAEKLGVCGCGAVGGGQPRGLLPAATDVQRCHLVKLGKCSNISCCPL